MEGGDMIALCVGHSRRGDQGAVSVDGTTEWYYNSDLAERVSILLDAAGVEHEVVDNYQAATYGAAMRWLGRELSKLRATLALELHFNWAETRAASGHEWLYWHKSAAGRAAALRLDKCMRAEFPQSLARGAKAVASGNGAGFLRGTPCPAVICEPFFGSSREDWARVAEQPLRLAQVLAKGIIALEGGAA